MNTFDSLVVAGTQIQYDFDSPGSIFSEGLPLNFLEGSAMPGDSGGGLLFEDLLIGITSYGEISGKYGQRDWATYLPAYKSWIDENTFSPVDYSTVAGFSPAKPILPTSSYGDIKKTFAVITEALGFYYFDPPSAKGWEFVVEKGSSIAGFLLPSSEAAGAAAMYLYDIANASYAFWKNIEPGVEVILPEGGVNRFLLTGLDTSSSDFVYALRFASSSPTLFTQQVYLDEPVAPAPVPVPASFLMVLTGIGFLKWFPRMRGRSTSK